MRHRVSSAILATSENIYSLYPRLLALSEHPWLEMLRKIAWACAWIGARISPTIMCPILRITSANIAVQLAPCALQSTAVWRITRKTRPLGSFQEVNTPPTHSLSAPHRQTQVSTQCKGAKMMFVIRLQSWMATYSLQTSMLTLQSVCLVMEYQWIVAVPRSVKRAQTISAWQIVLSTRPQTFHSAWSVSQIIICSKILAHSVVKKKDSHSLEAVQSVQLMAVIAVLKVSKKFWTNSVKERVLHAIWPHSISSTNLRWIAVCSVPLKTPPSANIAKKVS